jgi:hypothetical protein
VDSDTFQTFLNSLNGTNVTITTSNVAGLALLCEEFHCSGLAPAIRSFGESADSRIPEIERHSAEIRALRADVETLRQRVSQQQSALSQLNASVAAMKKQMASDSKTMKSTNKSVAKLKTSLVQATNAIATLRTTFEADINRLRSSTTAVEKTTSEGIATLRTECAALRLWGNPIDSRILSGAPSIFDEFSGSRFELLWRGSRDGFSAVAFHARCDGHGNTVTVILDTKGNIFGGYTPLTWESRDWDEKQSVECPYLKCDDSLKSFVFTVKNPSGIAPRRFPLKEDWKEWAIFTTPDHSPVFGSFPADFSVTRHSTELGSSYLNDTGLDGKTVLTGSPEFSIKEIEVFEIKPLM